MAWIFFLLNFNVVYWISSFKITSIPKETIGFSSPKIISISKETKKESRYDNMPHFYQRLIWVFLKTICYKEILSINDQLFLFPIFLSCTGVMRGRVSPCHLFPSYFAFPLGEMPNEGRRRMKIKVCLRVFKNLCLISVFVVLTTEPCKSSPSHHSLFVRCGEVTNSSF